jgi:hypothetical protein
MTNGMNIMSTRSDSVRLGGPASAKGFGAAGPMEERHAALERAFIDEFLRRVGHTPCSLQRLPSNQQTMLFRAASTFATLKLAEIESRARVVHNITGN